LKTLTILRHAKSGWDVQVERDFDRPINKRGQRGAEIIGQWLKRQKLPVGRIIASPAVRVTETLDIFQPAADLDTLEPHWDRRIYLASAATLIDVIRDTGRDAEHLLISGHNPGLEDLILMLVPESSGDALRGEVEDKLPTSALARQEPAPVRRAVVRSVHTTEPVPGVVEASAVVVDRGRVRAVALRLEGLDGRWRATALEMG